MVFEGRRPSRSVPPIPVTGTRRTISTEDESSVSGIDVYKAPFAVEHLAVARVRNMADFLAEARSAGCWCYGASAQPGPGGRAPVPYDAPSYSGAGVVLVLGSEGTGLRPRVAKACDELIALPLLGRVQSLGVSAAAAALLYGILQSRGPNP